MTPRDGRCECDAGEDGDHEPWCPRELSIRDRRAAIERPLELPEVAPPRRRRAQGAA